MATMPKVWTMGRQSAMSEGHSGGRALHGFQAFLRLVNATAQQVASDHEERCCR
jgi:hypothetical protein